MLPRRLTGPASVLAAALAGLLLSFCAPGTGATEDPPPPAPPAAAAPAAGPERLKMKVVSARPHDPSAYTQGLLWHEGLLYESAGQYGESTLRQVDPGTGEVRRRVDLPPRYFAEGLARVGDRLIQLTWHEGTAFVYRLPGLEKVGEHRYDGEGWGLCFDGRRLVMSDGSDRLVFRDPESFAVLGEVRVRRGGAPVDRLNELECVDGAVYANVWMAEEIVRIDPATGEVTAVVDASRLLGPADYQAGAEVLNGIAWLPESKRFLITGKRWPLIFEVELVPESPPGNAPPAAPSAPACWQASLLGDGPLVLPGGLKVDGLTVGGLSALAPAGGDSGVWLALVDNQAATPARFFELQLAVSERGAAPPPGRTAADVPRAAVRLEGLHGLNFDGEGLAATPWGTLLVASERGPSIREVSRAGSTLRELPVPPAFDSSLLPGRGIRGNQGFESLALSPDGRTLWTANEGALEQDAPDEALYGFHPVRLLRYERRGESFEPAGQLLYAVEPIDMPGPAFNIRGLAELLVLPEGGLLALEREFVAGIGMEVQLFHVDVSGAADISGVEAVRAGEHAPVRKTLLYDFRSAGFPVDNLEGMAWGPDLPGGDRCLLLVSDDNFEPGRQATQIVALRLRPAAHSATRGGS